jgi:PAS domain S-box-containing protein
MSTVKPILFQIIKRKESLLFLVLFLAGVSLVSGLFGYIHLTAGSPDYIPIAPSSAVMFITLSVLLLISINLNNSQITLSLVAFFVIIDVIYCSFIFLQYLFNLNWNIEYILIKNPQKFGNVFTGHMSPITSLLVVFISIGILGIRRKNSDTIKYIVGSISLLTCLASSVLLIGYLYNAPLLYGSKIIPVSLPAAICLFLLSITLLRIFELKFWTLNLISDNKITRQLLKSFLPIVIIVVILEGYLDTVLSFNDINPPLTSVLILVLVILVSIILVVRISRITGSQTLKTELELKASENKYRNLVDNIGEGIAYVDTNEHFIFTNSSAEKIFGVSEGELIGKNLEEFLSKEQYMLIVNQTEIRKKRESSIYEFELMRPDGAKRDIFITAVPQFDENGMFIGTIGIFRDFTESKQAQKALMENERKLYQLNINKDRFISILGHDLKNPFNNILGFSELLMEDIRKLNISEIENIAKNINISARITNKLLEDILMWARTQQGNIAFEPQSLNFKDICRDTMEILNQSACAKNISIDCVAADQLDRKSVV